MTQRTICHLWMFPIHISLGECYLCFLFSLRCLLCSKFYMLAVSFVISSLTFFSLTRYFATQEICSRFFISRNQMILMRFVLLELSDRTSICAWLCTVDRQSLDLPPAVSFKLFYENLLLYLFVSAVLILLAGLAQKYILLDIMHYSLYQGCQRNVKSSGTSWNSLIILIVDCNRLQAFVAHSSGIPDSPGCLSFVFPLRLYNVVQLQHYISL